MPLLEVQNLSFSYRADGKETHVLKSLNLLVEPGDFLAIRGRSGSGKSTLFHLLGCLLKPTSGKIFFEGQDLTLLNSDQAANLRNEKIGFIFQQFYLLSRATVLENILLPTVYPCERNQSRRGAKQRAKELADKLGLAHRLGHLPNQLSGGEQQRVVVARALMGQAQLILADEPTGNLDTANTEKTMALLKELNASGKTIILITHDAEVAAQCKRSVVLEDGCFVTQSQAELPKVPVSPVCALKKLPTTPATYFRLIRKVFPLAAENLFRNKIRAALTMIGVTVGIAAVFAMVTFGQYARKKILQGYEDLGVNSVTIRGFPNYNRKATDPIEVLYRSFQWEKDVLPLKHVFKELFMLSPLLSSWGNTINYGGNTVDGEALALGVSAEYLRIMNRPILRGRTLTPYHIENRSSVCLLGDELAQRLFHDEDPLNKILFVTPNQGGPYPCEIIGVMARQHSSRDYVNPNLELLLPYSYFSTVNPYWYDDINRFVAQFKPGSDIEKLSKGIEHYFEKKYGVSAQFSVDSDSLLLAQMKKFLSLFSLLLTAIALVTLSVGGMGINNMMLVSISERLKEIGLRKAVGATNRSIRLQFLLESVLLSVVAGVLGVGIGFTLYEFSIFIASKFINKLSFEWVFEPSALALSVISIALVGILSGIVPALRAERLSVIEALRNE